MTTNQAIAYAKQQTLGEISPEETILLKEWIENASRREYLQFSDACILFHEQLEDTAPEYQEAVADTIRHLDEYMLKTRKPLYARLLSFPETRVVRGVLSSPAAGVAAVLLIALTGGICWFLLRSETPEQTALTPPARTYIKPSLTLANGTVVTLDSPLISVPLPVDYTEQIRVEAENKANPYIKILPGVEGAISPSYHTIEAPPFRQYKISLPDGSLVWLNTGSRMQYLSPFGSADRKIRLTGEAYFEVAPNARNPFIVTAGNTEIKALGTRFNVHAYEDEHSVAVTLLSGSVKVTDSGNTQLLSPGEQALLSPGRFTLLHPDTTHTLNWKAGYFDFQRSSLQTIMRQISRWYNVKVVYPAGIDPGSYTGTLSRNIPLPDLITLLKHSGIKLDLQGDTITIRAVINTNH